MQSAQEDGLWRAVGEVEAGVDACGERLDKIEASVVAMQGEGWLGWTWALLMVVLAVSVWRVSDALVERLQPSKPAIHASCALEAGHVVSTQAGE